ncbi:MAG: ribosome silencing factor [Deltaproteobacteria bacterium]|nr:ribosome silencing factor [Deltaproteobacteria bacterium]
MKKNDIEHGLLMVKKLYAAALAAKAENIVALDVRGISGFADYFIIMSGRSSRHVQGLAATLDKEVRSKRLRKSSTEGLGEGRWVLLDFDDVVVHIFHDEDRQFYDLEGLWHAAPRLQMTDHI